MSVFDSDNPNTMPLSVEIYHDELYTCLNVSDDDQCFVADHRTKENAKSETFVCDVVA